MDFPGAKPGPDMGGGVGRALAAARTSPHRIVWRGEQGSGVNAAPGIYLVRLRAGEGSLTRRVVWLRD
jgi:hypothetical protein